MKALVIKKPWIDLILDGLKTWEIRGSRTKVRGTIELIQSGSGLVIGTAEIVDCIELSIDLYKSSFDKHQINEVGNLPYKKTYAWVMKNPHRYAKPRPYKHPQGAVIWVNLP